MHKVILLENDEVIRCWLTQLIAQADSLELIGTAPTVAGGMALLPSKPDIALVDLMLDDGAAYDFIRTVKETGQIRVLVLSVLGDEASVLAAIQAGADGYIKKEASEADLLHAIGAVMRGDAPISPAIARHVLRHFQSRQPASDQPLRNAALVGDKTCVLSPRELQVLEALACGLNYKEVARKYNLSHHTVAKYIKTVYRKLSVNNRAAAVVEGMRNGLIAVPGK